MNLNHVAKKPFFDLFIRKPCMPVFLRLAFHDSGTYDNNTGTGGANASIFHEIGHPDRPEHEGLQWALEQIKEI